MAAAEEHDVHLTGRRELQITGVKRVESFDVQAFELSTTAGNMRIAGQSLHMKQFDRHAGIVCIEGEIGAIVYDDGKQRGLMGRLLR
ncbi:sporulation protein YabP [Alicyclobacillus sacchari]|uniref:Sporulation protein YabP n=1 Tax=Alicyclobacillus sacchari TaxID=392010 RepID=A0A4R8LN74_9BACL|nr:YabP/YqfC family sporulation protein [Alicyclobacillus sacchari]TDY46359.1 sporulation protein YabP [Alicyclobacillus sacchari]GMA57115.1 hypothetical protein GCM10025858_16180 [Alicyclobacillus sacchari]